MVATHHRCHAPLTPGCDARFDDPASAVSEQVTAHRTLALSPAVFVMLWVPAWRRDGCGPGFVFVSRMGTPGCTAP